MIVPDEKEVLEKYNDFFNALYIARNITLDQKRVVALLDNADRAHKARNDWLEDQGLRKAMAFKTALKNITVTEEAKPDVYC